MTTYKRGEVYWYRFQWKGDTIRESTKQGNDKVARKLEAEHRARLATQDREQTAAKERLGCDNVLPCHECEELFNAEKAIRKGSNTFCSTKCAREWGRARSMPTLQAFLDDRFLPDAKAKHKDKPKTIQYYRQGVAMLKRSSLAGLRLDELTGEHSGVFAAENARLSPSGINMGLRTLRRALNLAYQWKVIERPVQVELAKNEVQRTRVLTKAESDAYIAACPQPWKDAAIVILNEGMRPGEVFVLRWEHLVLAGNPGAIQITGGKSKAAQRVLPMTPEVLSLVTDRWEALGSPREGWVFPSGSKSGHLEVQTAKRQHSVALAASKVAAFVPYTLRHTGLTRLAKAARGDVFAVAKIAGHSSITVTQKYVHPEQETVSEVFARLAGNGATIGTPKRKKVGTKVGTVGKRLTAGVA